MEGMIRETYLPESVVVFLILKMDTTCGRKDFKLNRLGVEGQAVQLGVTFLVWE